MAAKDPKHPESPVSRKGKPRDLAEVHKPSRKVALNEVLRSLQDLVNNELSVGTTESGTPKPKAAREPKSARTESAKSAGLEKENRRHGTGPVPPEGLQQELPLLDTTEPTPAGEKLERSPPPAPAIGQPESAPAPGPAPEADATSAEPVIPEVLPEPQSDKTFGPTGESPTPPSTDLIENDAAPIELEIDSLPETPEASAGEPEPGLSNGDTSDIPVLEDIIDLHDDVHHHGPALATTGDARRLAIQVAARLNVELRKAGKTGLNSDVITRLARLLGEALAEAGENTDNSPPEKH